MAFSKLAQKGSVNRRWGSKVMVVRMSRPNMDQPRRRLRQLGSDGLSEAGATDTHRTPLRSYSSAYHAHRILIVIVSCGCPSRIRHHPALLVPFPLSILVPCGGLRLRASLQHGPYSLSNSATHHRASKPRFCRVAKPTLSGDPDPNLVSSKNKRHRAPFPTTKPKRRPTSLALHPRCAPRPLQPSPNRHCQRASAHHQPTASPSRLRPRILFRPCTDARSSCPRSGGSCCPCRRGGARCLYYGPGRAAVQRSQARKSLRTEEQ
jgi:hypothetical protein